MQDNYYQQCPICNSDTIIKKYQIRSFIIDKCSNCKLVFVKDIIPADKLAEYYNDDSEEVVYNEDNTECLEFYYRRLKEKIGGYKPIPGKILDVGCAGGEFLDVMDSWERYGNEISENLAKEARKKYGTNIFIGDFNNYPLQENMFDVITLQDVMDHFIDPVRAIKKCKTMLKPGGLIVIKVHNISCLYAKFTKENFYALLPPFHLFYFDKQSLNFLLGSLGLKIKEYKFMPHLLKIQTIFFRLSRGNINSIHYRIFNVLNGSFFGNITIRKNLHDIVTVFAENNKDQ